MQNIKKEKRKLTLTVLCLLLALPVLCLLAVLGQQASRWMEARPAEGIYFCEDLDARLYCDQYGEQYFEFSDGRKEICWFNNEGDLEVWSREGQVHTGIIARGNCFWDRLGERLYIEFDDYPENVNITAKYYRFDKI